MPAAAAANPRRALVVLLAGAVLASTAYLLVLSVTPVLAGRFLADSLWIGVPNAALVLGVAAGASLLSGLIPRLGRPSALALGFSAAALASLAPAVAAARPDWFPDSFASAFPVAFWLHLGGSILLGAGYSAYHLTRYAAALLVPKRRRARAIGLVVWMAVGGSFAAPILFGWIERFAVPRGGQPIPLAYLAAALLFGGAGLLFFRSRTLRTVRSLCRNLAPASSPGSAAPDSRRQARRPRRSRLAVAAMVGTHAGMLFVMTMTPVRVVGGGGSFSSLGAIMGAHTLGMFALAPVVGILCDRWGERPVIAAGGGILLAAGALASVAAGRGVGLGLALYLVGLGWCLAFVAASAVLAEGPDSPAKVRRQGLADSLTWGTAAVVSVASGVLMTGFGFPVVALAAAALGLLPLGAAAAMPDRAGS